MPNTRRRSVGTWTISPRSSRTPLPSPPRTGAGCRSVGWGHATRWTPCGLPSPVRSPARLRRRPTSSTRWSRRRRADWWRRLGPGTSASWSAGRRPRRRRPRSWPRAGTSARSTRRCPRPGPPRRRRQAGGSPSCSGCPPTRPSDSSRAARRPTPSGWQRVAMTCWPARAGTSSATACTARRGCASSPVWSGTPRSTGRCGCSGWAAPPSRRSRPTRTGRSTSATCVAFCPPAGPDP
jgi:hypothetical protein